MSGFRRDGQTQAHAQARAAIRAHFRGHIGPQAERRMRAHLVGCQACRDDYEDVMGVMSLDPRAPSAEDRLARGLGFGPARGTRFEGFRFGGLRLRGLGWPALAGAVALGLLALWARPRPDDRTQGFTARGGPPAAAAPALLVYALTPASRTPKQVEDVFGARDEMAFAYRNPFEKSHLMVFSVDEHDQVYWYHPGWPDPTDNPKAVEITKSPGLHELPAAVSQAYQGEHLVIHALFTDQELTVRQVEAALAQRAWPLANTVDVTYRVKLAP